MDFFLLLELLILCYLVSLLYLLVLWVLKQ